MERRKAGDLQGWGHELRVRCSSLQLDVILDQRKQCSSGGPFLVRVVILLEMLRLATRGVSCRYRRAYSTISSDEINHFNRLAARWWDPSGELKLLHRMNEPRIKFLKQTLLEERELPDTKWLEGKTVLDVGCGAGIFSEVGHFVAFLRLSKTLTLQTVTRKARR